MDGSGAEHVSEGEFSDEILKQSATLVSESIELSGRRVDATRPKVLLCGYAKGEVLTIFRPAPSLHPEFVFGVWIELRESGIGRDLQSWVEVNILDTLEPGFGLDSSEYNELVVLSADYEGWIHWVMHPAKSVRGPVSPQQIGDLLHSPLMERFSFVE